MRYTLCAILIRFHAAVWAKTWENGNSEIETCETNTDIATIYPTVSWIARVVESGSGNLAQFRSRGLPDRPGSVTWPGTDSLPAWSICLPQCLALPASWSICLSGLPGLPAFLCEHVKTRVASSLPGVVTAAQNTPPTIYLSSSTYILTGPPMPRLRPFPTCNVVFK
jgi:hypothetical protein